MLVELSMVERYDAVREVLDGAAVTDVATRYGVDRRTLIAGWSATPARVSTPIDRNSRPDCCPHQMPADIEARIVELRSSPSWLVATHDPEQAAASSKSSLLTLRSTAVSCATALSNPSPADAGQTTTSAGGGCARSELWQIDVMGSLFLTEGSESSVVTGIDDHSRPVLGFANAATQERQSRVDSECAAILELLEARAGGDRLDG